MAADDAGEHEGEPDPAEQERLEDERRRKEAEELASFERRARWWKLHHGDAEPEDRPRAEKGGSPRDG